MSRSSLPGVLMAAGMVFVGAFVLWFCFNAAPGQRTGVFPFDLITYFYPMMEYAAERMARGDLPLWNPHSCCGLPFLATAQVGVFYPPNWLILTMPLEAAIPVLLFSEVALAGLFAAMFYRSLGVHYYASGIGGLLFVFTCILGETLWPAMTSTIMWMPFLLLCVEKFVHSGSWRWWIAFTFGIALQILAGCPQYLVYSSYLVLLYALFRLTRLWISRQCRATHILKRFGALGMGCLFAVGLSAVQLLPTMELSNNSLRHKQLTASQVHYIEQVEKSYLTVTGTLRNAVNPSPKWTSLSYPDGSGYLGLPTLGMIALSLAWGRRNPLVYFFLAVVMVFGVLSFGYASWSAPFYKVYAALPTGGMFATPMRLRLLVFFSLISLAILGLDYLHTWLKPNGTGRWPLGAVVICGIVLYVVVLFDLAHATAPYGPLRDIPITWGKGLRSRGRLLMSEKWLDKEIREAGLNRIAPLSMRPAKLIQPTSRPYSIRDYEPLAPRRWTEITVALGGQERMIMRSVGWEKARAIYDMASATKIFFVVRSPERASGDPDAEEQSRPSPRSAREAKVFDNPQALPRAYLVGRYEVHSSAEVLSRVLSGGFDYQNTVLLEDEPGMPSAPEGTPRQPADIVQYQPEQVSIRTNSDGERLLVLTDTWFPGWKATVDGVETEILRANYLFRAVRVPPGAHEVIFTYKPASFRAGLTVSLVSFFGLAGLGCWFARSERATSAPRQTAGKQRHQSRKKGRRRA